MKALVTGFDPFDGDHINPSWEAVRALPARLGGLDLTCLQVPTAFTRSAGILADALSADRYELVLAVGLAGGRGDLAVERVAINLIDAAIPDNDEAQPRDQPVIEGAPAAYFATLPAPLAVGVLRQAGLSASVSLSAGSFVCNALFYRLLHHAARGDGPAVAGFLHVPCLPEQAARRGTVASMALEDIVRGLQLVLAVGAETVASVKPLTRAAGS